MRITVSSSLRLSPTVPDAFGSERKFELKLFIFVRAPTSLYRDYLRANRKVAAPAGTPRRMACDTHTHTHTQTHTDTTRTVRGRSQNIGYIIQNTRAAKTSRTMAAELDMKVNIGRRDSRTDRRTKKRANYQRLCRLFNEF